jgi:hypothetical protein
VAQSAPEEGGQHWGVSRVLGSSSGCRAWRAAQGGRTWASSQEAASCLPGVRLMTTGHALGHPSLPDNHQLCTWHRVLARQQPVLGYALRTRRAASHQQQATQHSRLSQSGALHVRSRQLHPMHSSIHPARTAGRLQLGSTRAALNSGHTFILVNLRHQENSA